MLSLAEITGETEVEKRNFEKRNVEELIFYGILLYWLTFIYYWIEYESNLSGIYILFNNEWMMNQYNVPQKMSPLIISLLKTVIY